MKANPLYSLEFLLTEEEKVLISNELKTALNSLVLLHPQQLTIIYISTLLRYLSWATVRRMSLPVKEMIEFYNNHNAPRKIYIRRRSDNLPPLKHINKELTQLWKNIIKGKSQNAEALSQLVKNEKL